MRFLMITPDQHYQYGNLIEELHFNVFREHFMQLPRKDQKKATYIIAYTQPSTFVGGAWMVQRTCRQAPPDVRQLYQKHQEQKQYWECGGINSCLNPGNDTDQYFSAHFYQSLYRTILCYGKRIGIDPVVVHTTDKEREKINHFGIWPLTYKMSDSQNFGSCIPPYRFPKKPGMPITAKGMPKANGSIKRTWYLTRSFIT